VRAGEGGRIVSGGRATRRGFLARAAAAAALVAGGEAQAKGEAPSPAVQDAAASRAEERITAATVAEAEKIAGVRYTQAERELLLETLPEQRRRANRRPTPPLGQGDAPASVFRPRRDESRLRKAAAPKSASVEAVSGEEDALAFASLDELGAAMASGATTSVALTKLFLGRLCRFDERLRCLVTACEERGLREAAEADAERRNGRVRGPLHGVPYGLKDLFDTAGVRTTWGAEPYRERVPERDAAVVTRLREAGAVLVAKLSLGELAMGDVWFGGRTNNPWNLDEGSSGSSAGSCAAVAAGCVPFAVGTETLGSIVSPSMRCGTVGLRPTFGVVPLDGAMTLCWSLDKAGPIARSALDAWEVFRALAPGPATERSLPEVRGLRVGYVARSIAGRGETRALERRAVEALREAGVELVEITLPNLDCDPLRTILDAEAAASMEELTASGDDDRLAQQGPFAWPNFFRTARFISAIDYLQAERLRRRVIDAYARLFAPLAAIVGPSFGSPMLLATNFTGHPCLVVRAGFVERRPAGAPVTAQAKRAPHGISLWAAPDDEAVLIALGAELEARLGVARERPPGF
jgi:Asp-tRNA(Asn)/Glu-tRNA(Gln) amidotransferase A subunit family amidase